MATDLKIVGDVVMVGDRVAVETDQELRADLPKSHPLYNTRAARCVLAGMPDSIIGSGGKLQPIAKEVVTDPVIKLLDDPDVEIDLGGLDDIDR
jgi:hypothetical protein